MGELQLIRAYRIHPVGGMGPKPHGYNELLWQIRNFTRFFWVSGGLFAEMNIHQIDEICWIKDALPVLLEQFGHEFPWVRVSCQAAAGSIGKEAVPALVDTLVNNTGGPRIRAASWRRC